MREKDKSAIDKAYENYHFSEVKIDENCKIYRLKNETGTGEMRCYDLSQGIQLSFNDLNMNSSYQKIPVRNGILQIDYCIDGCYEIMLEKKDSYFIGKGDLSVTDLGKETFACSRIPLKRYVGITIFIDMLPAQTFFDAVFYHNEIKLGRIANTLCMDGEPSLIIRSRKEIDHILNEIYTIDANIRQPYCLIKVMELLLFLSSLERKDTQRPCTFSRPILEATQDCYGYLVQHPFEWIHVKELAGMFAISESSLKICFQYISGKAIGSFMRENRIKEAAELLIRKPDLSIGEISETAGYENQSKFTKAFKTIIGKTPSEFRKD